MLCILITERLSIIVFLGRVLEEFIVSQEVELQQICRALAERAEEADEDPRWPAASWELLKRSRGTQWCISVEHGGQGLSGPELFVRYEQLASACLTTCFILSQRDAAARRIRDAAHETLSAELLPALARGDTFTTVGLSQLTTSRQHGAPALTAQVTSDSVIYNGVMPWVTGASAADYFITGAVTEDGQQVLGVLPRLTEGVNVRPPCPLMALEGSITAEVRCENVHVDRRWLLAGPAAKVMASSRGGTGGLETSCLALGLAGAAIDYLHGEAEKRSEYRMTSERLEVARQRVREEMHSLAKPGATAESAAALRARANSLVLRATQAALTASKGTGFLRTHPAQRWARQALFFLVWSCPRPAAEATLAYLAPPDGCDAG